MSQQGADGRQLSAWLADLPVPWLPPLVAVLGVAAPVVTRRWARPGWSAAR